MITGGVPSGGTPGGGEVAGMGASQGPSRGRSHTHAHAGSHAADRGATGASGTAAARQAGRLRLVLATSATILGLQIVGGMAAHSLALLADAGHTFTDVFGVTMALVAIRFAARPATAERTFGYYRLEILAAAANAILLFLVA